MSLPKGFGDSEYIPTTKEKVMCKLRHHDFNTFARSWYKIDDNTARVKHSKCNRCGIWDYDEVIAQAQPSSTFDNFTTDRSKILGLDE